MKLPSKAFLRDYSQTSWFYKPFSPSGGPLQGPGSLWGGATGGARPPRPEPSLFGSGGQAMACLSAGPERARLVLGFPKISAVIHKDFGFDLDLDLDFDLDLAGF